MPITLDLGKIAFSPDSPTHCLLPKANVLNSDSCCPNILIGLWFVTRTLIFPPKLLYLLFSHSCKQGWLSTWNLIIVVLSMPVWVYPAFSISCRSGNSLNLATGIFTQQWHRGFIAVVYSEVKYAQCFFCSSCLCPSNIDDFTFAR